MKKFLAFMLLLSQFTPFSVFADEIEKETEPGLTPDSPFYFLDGWFEDIEYLLANGDAKKATVLIEHARERLAEAKVMDELGEEDYLKETIEDYIEKINEASEKIAELNLEKEENESEDTDEESKEDELSGLEDELDDIISESDEIEDKLPEEIKDEMEEAKSDSYTKSTIVKNIERDVVIKLKEEYDLGLGEIAKLHILSKETNVDIEELAKQFIELEDFGELAKLYELKVSDLKEKAVEDKRDKLEDRLENAVENGNEEAANKIQEKIIYNEKENISKDLREEFNLIYKELLAEFNVEHADELTYQQKKLFLELLRKFKEDLIEEIHKEIEEKEEEIDEEKEDDDDVSDEQDDEENEDSNKESGNNDGNKENNDTTEKYQIDEESLNFTNNFKKNHEYKYYYYLKKFNTENIYTLNKEQVAKLVNWMKEYLNYLEREEDKNHLLEEFKYFIQDFKELHEEKYYHMLNEYGVESHTKLSAHKLEDLIHWMKEYLEHIDREEESREGLLAEYKNFIESFIETHPEEYSNMLNEYGVDSYTALDADRLEDLIHWMKEYKHYLEQEEIKNGLLEEYKYFIEDFRELYPEKYNHMLHEYGVESPNALSAEKLQKLINWMKEYHETHKSDGTNGDAPKDGESSNGDNPDSGYTIDEESLSIINEFKVTHEELYYNKLNHFGVESVSELNEEQVRTFVEYINNITTETY